MSTVCRAEGCCQGRRAWSAGALGAFSPTRSTGRIIALSRSVVGETERDRQIDHQGFGSALPGAPTPPRCGRMIRPSGVFCVPVRVQAASGTQAAAITEMVSMARP